jgi:hypothetical protein
LKEVDGHPAVEATLHVPAIQAAEGTTVSLPDDLVQSGNGETWLTVRAELADATPWADAGHEVALGQFELTAPGTIPSLPAWPAPPSSEPNEPVITLGPAQFDAMTGQLRQLYGLNVAGPRLELWRRQPITTGAAFAAPSNSPLRKRPTAKGHQGHRLNSAGGSVVWIGWCTDSIRFAAIMINCRFRYASARLATTSSSM